MVSTAAAPARGDVVWIDMAPSVGHEQTGRRPALVISPADYNARVGLALFCPITSQVKGYPFEVPLPDDAGITGVVLADEVKSLDWRGRGAKPAGHVPDEVTAAVVQRLGRLVAL
jgi:mRNA interferase MazF